MMHRSIRHRTVRTSCAMSVLVVVMLAMTAACGGGSNGSAGGSAKSLGPKISAQAKLTKELPKPIQSSKVLRVGVALGSAPDDFQSKQGQIVGWEPDIMRAVGQVLGVQVKFHPAGFDSLIPSLQANRFDAAVGEMGITNERKKVVDFVDTILGNELFVVKKGSSATVGSLQDLCGRTVATIKGSVEASLATEQDPKCKAAGKNTIDLKVFNDADQAGEALMAGRVEIFWDGSTAASYFMKKTSGQTKAVGHYGDPYPWGIALPKNSKLAKPLQGAVQYLIEHGQYHAILSKWGLASSGIKHAQIDPQVSG